MNDVLKNGREEVLHAFRSLAFIAAQVAEAEDVIDFWDLAKELESVSSEVIANARMKMLLFVQRNGTPIPDGKGLQLVCGTRKVECRKSRDGLDVKKIQAWLRSKGESPQRALAEKITYALAPDTEQWLRECGANDDVLRGLNTEEATWSVYKPVEVNES